MPELVLDTDILSALMRHEPLAIQHAGAYLAEYRQLTISIITRYEVLRGLKAKGASRQVQTFDLFCETCRVLPITDDVVVTAADIYADLRARGEPIGDADILIAASALAHGCGVASQNVGHFGRIHGLHVENWLT